MVFAAVLDELVPKLLLAQVHRVTPAARRALLLMRARGRIAGGA